MASQGSPKKRRARKSEPSRRNLNFPLPFEIRDQILTYLLTSTHVLELNRGMWPLYPYRNHQVRINHPLLSQHFRTFTRVSRQMRHDAISVLFYRNKWKLTISLRRDEEAWRTRLSRQFVSWDSASMVMKMYGPGAFLSMRYLKIVIENENSMSQKRIQSPFQKVLSTLGSSRNLRRLEVEWLNYESVDGNARRSTRERQRASIQRFLRKEGGTRMSTKHFRNGVSRWEEGQKILNPLEGLRGIPEALVTGSVTDNWAQHLEKCMKSER